MKLLLIFLILPFFCNSQSPVVSVSNNKMCRAYVGIPNPIKIAVEGYKPEDLTVTVESYKSSATITSMGYGKYDLRVKEGKEGHIIIVANGDTIGKHQFLVYRVPQYTHSEYIVNWSKDAINIEKLIATDFVLNEFLSKTFDYDYEFKITNYIFNHTDTTKNINKTIECEGNRLNKKIKKYISKLPVGSEISFTIFCIGPDNEKRKLEPLVLQLKS